MIEPKFPGGSSGRQFSLSIRFIRCTLVSVHSSSVRPRPNGSRVDDVRHLTGVKRPVDSSVERSPVTDPAPDMKQSRKPRF